METENDGKRQLDSEVDSISKRPKSEVSEVIAIESIDDETETQAKREVEKKRKLEIKMKEKQEREESKQRERQEKQEKREQEKREREAKKEMDRQIKLQRDLEKQQKKEEDRKERERIKEEEKKERERIKEEERKQREKLKEEEKKERERIKEEEKKERERLKEEERIEKERIKEEERREKEKGQRKIASFFSINQKKPLNKTPTVSHTVFDELFLPFNVKQNTVMHTSTLSPDELSKRKIYFDELLNGESRDVNSQLSFKVNKLIIKDTNSVTPEEIINALNSSEKTETEIYEMLKHIPTIKYIEFYENAKPPYIGTWCSKAHKNMKFPILEPFNTEITGYDYGYDSDLDWNEEEEGEDIEDEDDEDDDDEEDDDMDDFVESNDSKPKKFLGPLESSCVWNDGTMFDDLKYERLNPNVEFPIDPTCDNFKDNDEEPSEKKDTNKQIIQDREVVQQLIKFIQKYKDFSISTLVDLSKKEFVDVTKATLKMTIQDIASYNKKMGVWEVKSEHLGESSVEI